MKNHPKCGTPVPEDAEFCPWCGKAQAETSKEKGGNDSAEPRFTSEQLSFLRNLIGELCESIGEFSFSEEEIRWETSYSIWGVHDGSGTDTCELTLTPIFLEQFDLQDFRRGFHVEKARFQPLFKFLASTAQTGPSSGVWSVTRPYHWRKQPYRFVSGCYTLHVHESYSLAVHNPMGIGVDILVTYEHYDNMD